MALKPYGSAGHAADLAKVGKSKTPCSLAARMPSIDISAKVGRPIMSGGSTRRVRRCNAQV